MTISISIYQYGSEYVAIEVGMPSDPTRIGVGETPEAAEADLSDTGVQSSPLISAERRTISWATGETILGLGAALVGDAIIDDEMRRAILDAVSSRVPSDGTANTRITVDACIADGITDVDAIVETIREAIEDARIEREHEAENWRIALLRGES